MGRLVSFCNVLFVVYNFHPPFCSTVPGNHWETEEKQTDADRIKKKKIRAQRNKKKKKSRSERLVPPPLLPQVFELNLRENQKTFSPCRLLRTPPSNLSHPFHSHIFHSTLFSTFACSYKHETHSRMCWNTAENISEDSLYSFS